MKIYKATLNSDNGKHVIRTAADNQEQAIKIICMVQGCPERAIIKIQEVKN